VPEEVEIQLYKLKRAIKDLVEQAKDDEGELDDILDIIKDLKQQYRVLRGEYDLLYFAYQYFSDSYNPDNDNNLIPDNYRLKNAPDFHKELCGILDSLNEDPAQKICWSVPRGHAKSAYLSNIFPIHQIVYEKRHYILIISETESASKKFVEWVNGQLKFNKKLIKDFGVILHENKLANTVDNEEGFVTITDIRVQSASIGKQLRGARHGAYRPDLVVLDDLESAKNTNTKELREKNLHWFNSVIVPIGDITSTAYIYMGTLVHGQGLLPNILHRSDFKSKIYSAIVSEPENQELWEKVEKILRNVEDPDREDKAEEFYYEHKEEMDKGAKTLWNDRFPYFELMKIKINIGSRAFGSEYLNRPTDDETAIFKPSQFTYFEDKDLFYPDGRSMNLEVFGFFDMAIGKNQSSDYNAVIILGRDRKTGILYVLDAWAMKVPIHRAVDVAFMKIKEFRPKTFGVETIQMQYEIYRQLQERVTKEGVYSTRILPVNPRTKKEDRIEVLEPLVEQGIIRFRREQRLLIEQLTQFPNGDYDDLPDALASAVDIAGKQRKKTYYRKPKGF
jgi:predicted phage terminase large subunit-like protein